MDDVQLICIADCHFGQRRPVARAGDWKQARRRVLDQLWELQATYKCPIVCAGDILHSWREPAELVNFLLRYMPTIHSIAGNHDCPWHDLKELSRSAFWTLVEAGKVVYIPPGKPVEVNPGRPIRLHGFPVGHPVKPLAEPHDMAIEVAVCHEYVWRDGTNYVGAKSDTHVETWKARTKGYDLIIVGDNHHSFLAEFRKRVLWNCGGLMRRNADEIDYSPSVGLFLTDGTMKRHFLDVSKDEWDNTGNLMDMSKADVSGFVDELASLAAAGLDFGEAVKRTLDEMKPSDSVRKAVLGALDSK